MTRYLLSIVLAMCAALACAAPADSVPHAAPEPISATVTARDAGSAQWFFAMAPSDVLPLLPVNTRLDMLDYYNSGVNRASRDAAGGRAVITSSAARRLTFEMGDSCSYELAVFTAGADTVVAIVETICYPMADSRVEWYGSRWQPLKPLLDEPQLDDWLTREGRRHRAEVEEALPFITARITADPDAGTLTIARTIDSYFHPTAPPEALRWLEPSLTYRLRGAKFVKK